MAGDWTIVDTIADLDGRLVVVGFKGPLVGISLPSDGATALFGAAARERFQRAFMEAERQAEAAS